MREQNELLTTRPDVDEEGFLLKPESWTPDVARVLAEGEVPGELTDDHWMVIDFMREYYLEFGSVPPVRMLARRTGLSLRRIKALFPKGLTHGACKYAGIPRITIKPSYLYP